MARDQQTCVEQINYWQKIGRWRRKTRGEEGSKESATGEKTSRRGDERFLLSQGTRGPGTIRYATTRSARRARTLARGFRRSVAPRRVDRFDPLSDSSVERTASRETGRVGFRESSRRRHLRDCADPRGGEVPSRPQSTPRRFVTRSESVRRSSRSSGWPPSPRPARFRRAAAAAAPSRLSPPGPPGRRDICPRRASPAAAPLAPRRSPPPRSSTPSATPPPRRATSPPLTPPCASTSSSSAAASPA
jgi:hypothetical protein